MFRNRARHIQSLVEFVLSTQAPEDERGAVVNAMQNRQPYATAKYASDAVKHYAGIGDSEWGSGKSRENFFSGEPSSPHKEIYDTMKDAVKGLSNRWNTPVLPSEPSYATRTSNDIVRTSFPKPPPPDDPGGLSDMPPPNPSGPFPDRP